MGKFCSNCGNELTEGADVCLKCGTFLNKPQERKTSPGKGLAIAGMVLGIVACFWVFIALLSLERATYMLDYYDFYYAAERIGYSIGLTLFSLAPSIVGLCLSISSIKKQKRGMNVAGVILNTIALALSVIIFIIVLAH